MTHIKQLWQLTPKVLRSLLATVLIIILAGSSVLGAQRDVTPPHQPNSQLISRRTSPGFYTAPSSCSLTAPLVPALVTAEEIGLRQFQIDFAKFIEEQAKLDQEAGLTLSRDVLNIQKYRLDCEIVLLKAKQALAGNGTFSLPDTAVTTQELELRKRQFAIAEQVDEDATLSQAEGLVSLNTLWTSRRDRIDSEILLLQATVQKRFQDLQNNPE